MSFNFPWKTILMLKPYEIATNNYYNPLLNEMIEYKISEYEIENLPPSYIIHFISILQYFCQNKNLKTVIYQNPNKDKEKDNKIFELELNVEELEREIQTKDNIILEYEKIVKSLQNNLSNTKYSYRSKLNEYKKRIKENEDKKNDNKLEELKIWAETKILMNNQYPNMYPPQYYNNNENNNMPNSQLKSKKKSLNKEEEDEEEAKRRKLKNQRKEKILKEEFENISNEIKKTSRKGNKVREELKNEMNKRQSIFDSQISTLKNNNKRLSQSTRFVK